RCGSSAGPVEPLARATLKRPVPGIRTTHRRVPAPIRSANRPLRHAADVAARTQVGAKLLETSVEDVQVHGKSIAERRLTIGLRSRRVIAQQRANAVGS